MASKEKKHILYNIGLAEFRIRLFSGIFTGFAVFLRQQNLLFWAQFGNFLNLPLKDRFFNFKLS
jgi:hypothetical protein